MLSFYDFDKEKKKQRGEEESYSRVLFFVVETGSSRTLSGLLHRQTWDRSVRVSRVNRNTSRVYIVFFLNVAIS
jgi:hypothetical protein